jgi:membrane-associated phospholipid phosphatase
MERRIANLLSYITHPLLTPMLGLLVISNSGTYAADIDHRFNQFIYLSVFVLTFLLPATLIPFFRYMDLAKTMHFHDRKERLMPLYITLIFYLAAYFLIRKLPVSQVYQRFLFSACLSILLVLAISYFWKISSHLTGWGGLVGLIFSLSVRFDTDLMLFLIISILVAGFIGFARLRLDAHNSLQVYSGFLLGFLTMLMVFFI